MPFVFWNVSDVLVEHCELNITPPDYVFLIKLTHRAVSVIQSPLWSINIMNGTSMSFDDIYVNNTALDAAFVSFPFAFNHPSWN